MAEQNLSKYPIHLGLGATATQQAFFTGEMDWYQGYGERNSADGAEGRLVSMHTFDQPWDVWEMHPLGAEVVLCVDGQIELIQEREGKEVSVVLNTGEYVINDPGVWHTANVESAATCVFITAGQGTEHRPR